MFEADGVTPVGPAILMPNVVTSAIHTPRSSIGTSSSTGVVQELLYASRLSAAGPALRTRVESLTSAGDASALVLATDGRSRYREGQITARYSSTRCRPNRRASYTRSSAIGNLNDFNSYFGNIENP